MQTNLSHAKARPSAFLLAALVLGLTVACMSRAYAVSATPNASQVRYSFAGNGEVFIVVPVINQPVHVMATCETVGTRGIAFAEVMRSSPSPFFLEWTGQNSPGAGAGSNTSGFSAANETLIAEVDFGGQVELEVASSATMAVSNESGAARAGWVTLIW